MIEDLKNSFIHRYGGSSKDVAIYFAPGRVNLIGEHIDYNGGNVLPFALGQGTYLAIRKLSEATIRMQSLNYPFELDLKMGRDIPHFGKEWVNYPLGVINELKLMNHSVGGFEALFSGNIPPESGLSSSASIEIVTAFALNDLFAYGLSMYTLVMLTQRAENNFVGTQCGIMDMYAIGFGKKDHALYLNTETRSHQYVAVHTGDYRLVIANTQKKRGLADSKYNERLAECRQALKKLSTYQMASSLCASSANDLKRILSANFPPLLRKRVGHVVSENERVAHAVKALSSGDMISLGKLMNASHQSLKNDYEVSCFELDVMVEEAQKIEGLVGARMTGAGFGGCTINLVRKDKLDGFTSQLGSSYHKRTGRVAAFYLAEAGGEPEKII